MWKDEALNTETMILTEKVMALYYNDKLNIEEIHKKLSNECSVDFVKGVVYAMNNFLLARDVM